MEVPLHHLRAAEVQAGDVCVCVCVSKSMEVQVCARLCEGVCVYTCEVCEDTCGAGEPVEFWGPWWLDVQQPLSVCDHPCVALRVYLYTYECRLVHVCV